MRNKQKLWFTSSGYLTFEQIKENAKITKLDYWISYYNHLRKYEEKEGENSNVRSNIFNEWNN